jgi:hypothetical protein
VIQHTRAVAGAGESSDRRRTGATSPRRSGTLVGNELGLLLGEELGITLVLSSLWVFSSQASSILASSVSLSMLSTNTQRRSFMRNRYRSLSRQDKAKR